jgi:putative ABC transport system permease protein
MTQLFGIPLDTLTKILLGITLVIVGAVALLALTNLIFFKIGVRNIPRRRVQMVLIVFALMLSTTLLSSVLATGDVITAAVKSVAIYNLGNVDEIVQGGYGSLGIFDESVYYNLVKLKSNYHDIAAVGAALVENNLLVADVTSRQVRGIVTGLGIVPGSEEGFGGMQNDNGKGHLSIAELQPNSVYLNHTIAQLLNAHAGDTLYLYSQRWQGTRFQLHVQGIVADGGLAGGKPYLLTNIETFRAIENRGNRDSDIAYQVSQIYIANRGGGGLNGVDLSDDVTAEIEKWIPHYVHVIEVKEQGVQDSLNAQEIFSRIFTLFCLFALAIGLLLIFLIFVLLAAERRAEMGMARAIGVQRGQLVLMFLFEGTVYDLLASFVGLGFGVGIGALLVNYLGPILLRFDFPLTLTFQPRSLVIAYCLGVIFTFCSVAISAWLVSRMTIVDALRNLPESERPTLTLGEIVVQLLHMLGQSETAFAAKKSPVALRILLEQIPDLLVSFVRSLVVLGLLPLVAGYLLLEYGLQITEIIPFSLGFSLLVIGTGLLLKAIVEKILSLFGINKSRLLQRLLAAVVGLTIVAYWALPFDILASLGLPRFQGGIEVFFIAGSMMVFGAAWALIANAELLVHPLLKLCSSLPGLHIMTRLASAYPLHHRFRTGLSVIMFSLVIFTMTVMAIITNAMQNNYTNFDVQTGGYDIQAVAYFKQIPDIRAALASHGINPNDFTAIGVRTSTVAGVIQLNAKVPAWHIYPAQVVNGGFLQGYGLHLVARAQGFNSDSAVWQALQSHPNYALIDDDALPYPPNYLPPVYDPSAPRPNDAGSPNSPPGFDPYYAFSLGGVYQGAATFAPTPLWVTNFNRTTKALKVTIIGVVDNSDSAHFGLYINQSFYGNVVTNPNDLDAQTYYFKVAPGQDKRALALSLGSAFLDNGLETTVLEDAIWQLRGPRILISDILLSMVGMVLLLGVAALAIIGTRAVVERRQQIGMLRALGSSRLLLQGAFLCESFLVGTVGSVLGVVLGVILSRNIFAANFFEQFHTGLAFTIPWDQLGLIVGVALAASLLAAILPAWQAGRVTPTEALRY